MTARKTSLLTTSAVTAAALAFVGGLAFLPGKETFDDFLGIVHHPIREKFLPMDEDGPFYVYYANKHPDAKLKALGIAALDSWRTADRKHRNMLIDEIMAGNVLEGMTKDDALKYLGESQDDHPYRYDAPAGGLFYDVTFTEGSCHLCIAVLNGRITDSILRVNN
ncbi:hypothetical protein KF728_29580 [Candidatus Obscuribacterales bacterium]|nr:hypothetical protein [Candidatus Obscuribacterales bacterium]MBX3154340.1 hypothetical protein [Candidatus Obscuribacterales bacterium]